MLSLQLGESIGSRVMVLCLPSRLKYTVELLLVILVNLLVLHYFALDSNCNLVVFDYVTHLPRPVHLVVYIKFSFLGKPHSRQSLTFGLQNVLSFLFFLCNFSFDSLGLLYLA